MSEKRFIGSYAGFYDKYKENRLLWSEWEEITRILNNLNEKSVERSKALSKLQKENKQLKEELGSFEQVSFTDICDGSRTILYMKKENGDSEFF